MKASNVGKEFLHGRHKKYEDRPGLPGLQPCVSSVPGWERVRAGGGGPRFDDGQEKGAEVMLNTVRLRNL